MNGKEASACTYAHPYVHVATHSVVVCRYRRAYGYIPSLDTFTPRLVPYMGAMHVRRQPGCDISRSSSRWRLGPAAHHMGQLYMYPKVCSMEPWSPMPYGVPIEHPAHAHLWPTHCTPCSPVQAPVSHRCLIYPPSPARTSHRLLCKRVPCREGVGG